MQGYVSAVSEEGYSCTVIQKRYKSCGFSISKSTIENFINKMGKNRHTLTSKGRILLNIHVKRKRKKFCCMFKESKEGFSKRFMIAVAFSFKDRKKVKKVDKNVKVSSKYCQEQVLFLVFKYEIQDLFSQFMYLYIIEGESTHFMASKHCQHFNLMNRNSISILGILVNC